MFSITLESERHYIYPNSQDFHLNYVVSCGNEASTNYIFSNQINAWIQIDIEELNLHDPFLLIQGLVSVIKCDATEKTVTLRSLFVV